MLQSEDSRPSAERERSYDGGYMTSATPPIAATTAQQARQMDRGPALASI